MTYFKQALSAPELHFKRLRQIKPTLHNGEPVISRTHSTMECEVHYEDYRLLLSLPFHRKHSEHIVGIETIARERSRYPLLINLILHDELVMADSLGRTHHFDIILQPIPEGETLKEAAHHYKADELRKAVKKMKQRLDTIGFRHNNLTPSNIIIRDNGEAHPLRYWYAEWETYSNNDISQALEYIESHYKPDIDGARLSFCKGEEVLDSAPVEREGIRCLCKCGRFGFVDCDGRNITSFVYTSASDFHEGRAIVKSKGKVGAINNKGLKVIPTIYDSIEFDIETGLFTATRGPYRYLMDYEGKIIRRSEKE